MKILQRISLFFMVFLLIGCSSSDPKPIQPDNITPVSNISDSIVSNPDNNLVRTAAMDIPYPPPDMYWLKHSLRLFWQTTGQFPENMKSFIDNGFPLIWPRESKQNIPFYLNMDKDYIPSEELFGSFQYNWISPDEVQYRYVYIDFKTYRATEDVIWVVKTATIPFADKQMHNSQENLKELESILVLGGKERVDLISDSDARFLYSQCGLFCAFIETMTDIYHIQEGVIPSSFYDLLGSEQLIIKENFYNFAQLLESSNAEFKWGFDNKNKTSYIYLKINDEVLITRCINYTTDNLLDQMECEFDSLDISTPILTEKNIASIEIPEEYLISIKDIPVNES